MSYTLHHGDCLAVLRTLQDKSVDAVVCDPPYGLSFMGKRWDYDVPAVEVWAQCLRVLKPGGHLLAFAGTRTQHRMACRVEDAGFDIRDLIAWVYGSGFPKSLDVSKAIDARGGASVAWFGPWFRKWREDRGIAQRQVAALFPSKTGALTGCVANWELGFNMPTPEQFNLIRDTFGLPFKSIEAAEREVVAQQRGTMLAVAPGQDNDRSATTLDVTAPATPAARAWQGWGTALKPALEPITVARKPLDGTVAENVLAHGTGALNVDGCRVGASIADVQRAAVPRPNTKLIRPAVAASCQSLPDSYQGEGVHDMSSGRWPANLIHDGSEEVVGLFPCEDSGSAARFFYCAKAAGEDRDAGALGLFWRAASTSSGWEQIAEALYWTLWNENEAARKAKQRPPHVISRGNLHPTVKPTDLMRYLCRLVTPPNGVVLDPFTGSGSTGRGAILEGFRFVGIEREADYLAIARARIDDAIAMRARETAQLALL